VIRALALTLLFAFAPAMAAVATPTAPADSVHARLAPAGVLRGRFEQEKQVQGFRQPLRSTGDFVVAPGRGVVWNTRQPFASTLVLTAKQVQVRKPDGTRKAVGKSRGGRAAALVNQLMVALLAGDLPTLQKRFELQETLLPEGRWRLDLVPRESALKRAFARLELEGGRHVDAVRLDERSGDRTTLRFLDLRDAPATLAPAEAAEFD
jgi:hypothetical protein